jgi:hypothetical protein
MALAETVANFFKSNPSAPSKRVAEVGWLLQNEKASIIWDDPAPYRRDEPKPNSAKSVVFCPAVVDFDARHFVVRCPVDLHLKFRQDDKGELQLANAAGEQSTIRSKHLNQMVTVVRRPEWRHPNRPIIQVMTPYLFVADEPVYINQLPPFMDFVEPTLPGVMIAGRFPIHIWPRPLMWAFEWFDVRRDLTLKRGQPWFYARFEAEDPARPIRVVEAKLTPEGVTYLDSIAGVTNYVNRTFSLFDRAKKRRPAKLFERKTPSATEPS